MGGVCTTCGGSRVVDPRESAHTLAAQVKRARRQALEEKRERHARGLEDGHALETARSRGSSCESRSSSAASGHTTQTNTKQSYDNLRTARSTGSKHSARSGHSPNSPRKSEYVVGAHGRKKVSGPQHGARHAFAGTGAKHKGGRARRDSDDGSNSSRSRSRSGSRDGSGGPALGRRPSSPVEPPTPARMHSNDSAARSCGSGGSAARSRSPQDSARPKYSRRNAARASPPLAVRPVQRAGVPISTAPRMLRRVSSCGGEGAGGLVASAKISSSKDEDLSFLRALSAPEDSWEPLQPVRDPLAGLTASPARGRVRVPGGDLANDGLRKLDRDFAVLAAEAAGTL